MTELEKGRINISMWMMLLLITIIKLLFVWYSSSWKIWFIVMWSFVGFLSVVLFSKYCKYKEHFCKGTGESGKLHEKVKSNANCFGLYFISFSIIFSFIYFSICTWKMQYEYYNNVFPILWFNNEIFFLPRTREQFNLLLLKLIINICYVNNFNK